MKKFRKLIPAFVLLLISTAIMSTATFAWFSMNTKVDVTGMQITAKSNNTFLLIGDSANQDDIQDANTMSIAMTVADNEAYVFPSKPVEDAADLAVLSGATAITAATANDPEKWYTAASNDPGFSTENSSGISTVVNAQVLSSGNFAQYVIKKTVYLTVADGSDPAYNLTVKLSSFTDGLPVISGAEAHDNSAVRILVVSGGNMVTLTPTDLGTAKNLHASVNQVIVSTGTTQVDIYIYYDGTVDTVFTNNIADLRGASFTLDFNVEVKPAE